MQRISNYIAITIIVLIINSFSVRAQQAEKVDTIPWWNGFRVELDIAAPIFSAIGLSESYTSEGAVQFNLKHKYFPVVELGVSGIRNKASVNGAKFSTDGMFGRIGADVNLLKYKPGKPFANNLFLVGGRVGMSSFSYDLMNITITDDYWGTTEVRNFSNTPATKWWIEVVVGMRVEIVRNVFLGWNVRMKSLLGTNTEGKIYPYFVPGYGVSQSSNWAFNYTVGYKF